MRPRLAGWRVTRLRLWLALFFLALAIPTALLVKQAYSQLKWEAFHHAQSLAQEVARQIERDFDQFVEREEARAYGDYAFLVVGGNQSAGFLRPSSIAGLPAESGIPGLLGYFQVGEDGSFSTPLLPAAGIEPSDWALDTGELRRRQKIAERLQQILLENRLVMPVAGAASRHGAASGDQVSAEAPLTAAAEPAAPAAVAGEKSRAAPVDDKDVPSGQALFDRLGSASRQAGAGLADDSLGKVAELRLEERYPAEPEPTEQYRETDAAKRAGRKELAALPEAERSGFAAAATARPQRRAAAQPAPPLKIRTFESAIDPLEFNRLASGQFVLYRKVWREGSREIQGLLLEALPWLRGMVEPLFRETPLTQTTDLVVAYRGNVLTLLGSQSQRGYLPSASELQGELLSRSRLRAPFSELELIFSVQQLPAGPGASVLAWLSAVLALVLLGGFILLERLGTSQIRLARQQRDFVSAVSHELKTPLTAIRMYAEMLGEGWAPEEKKAGYYEYIRDESERLSRLIENVLQLARLTRNDLQVNLKPLRVDQLMDGIRSRVDAQLAVSGFTLSMDCERRSAGSFIVVDEDLFAQIIINLVDNAVKFSAGAARRQVDISCRDAGNGTVAFSVRDYGPGLPDAQHKKVFELFYRMENELTRETTGTGIGLALVHQLATAMGGAVDVRNRHPGAEFSVTFSVAETGASGPIAQDRGD